MKELYINQKSFNEAKELIESNLKGYLDTYTENKIMDQVFEQVSEKEIGDTITIELSSPLTISGNPELVEIGQLAEKTEIDDTLEIKIEY